PTRESADPRAERPRFAVAWLKRALRRSLPRNPALTTGVTTFGHLSKGMRDSKGPPLCREANKARPSTIWLGNAPNCSLVFGCLRQLTQGLLSAGVRLAV